MDRKGNFNALGAFGWTLVTFAILIGLGMLVLNQFGQTAGGTPNTTIQTIIGYLGTSNGGLASWIPIIIVVFIAGLIMAIFGGKGKSY